MWAQTVAGIVQGLFDFLKPAQDQVVVYQLEKRQKNVGFFLVGILLIILTFFIIYTLLKRI